MKLSISNIAWPQESDKEVYSLLQECEVPAIEVAPTRIWPDWQYASADVNSTREELQAVGLQCSSLQAIVYARPDLKVFGTSEQRQALITHLKKVADIAAGLGAFPLVFGAPKNRDRQNKTDTEAFDEAVALFAEVGEYCHQVGVCLCIEPNPTDYGCNFITDSTSGAELVRAVDSPGVGLHLDVAGMYLAGESIPQAIEKNADVLTHIHISEPYLGSFREPQVDHHDVAKALAAIAWQNWTAIEMRATDTPVADVQRAIEFVQDVYYRHS